MGYTADGEDVVACIILGIVMGIVITMVVMAIFGGSLTGKNSLAQKCAETQGRYDFCVQKISYEVKK